MFYLWNCRRCIFLKRRIFSMQIVFFTFYRKNLETNYVWNLMIHMVCLEYVSLRWIIKIIFFLAVDLHNMYSFEVEKFHDIFTHFPMVWLLSKNVSFICICLFICIFFYMHIKIVSLIHRRHCAYMATYSQWNEILLLF